MRQVACAKSREMTSVEHNLSCRLFTDTAFHNLPRNLGTSYLRFVSFKEKRAADL